MQPVFSQLGIKDIRPLMAAWEGPDREKVFKELEAGSPKSLSKDFETLGEAVVSAGELFRTKIEDLKFDAVNKSLGEFVQRLRDDGNVTLKDLAVIVKDVTASLIGLNKSFTNFGPDSWWKGHSIGNFLNQAFGRTESDKDSHLVPTKIDTSR